MYLKQLQIKGFKSFGKSTTLDFPADISAVVGPNGSGKSNVVESIAWVLGEQSVKSLRGKKGEDLIFNGSPSAPKTSKASVVLAFSGTGRSEDTLIGRSVYRDGTNEYFLNGSRCRLKDVVEFLGSIGLGASRHHIISQGEADRILTASAKERKQMVEDALGLRVYQMKRDESKRKLFRTEENMRQTKSLRNEIQPHLRFLKKQVDKASKAAQLKEKLEEMYSFYFSGLDKKFKSEMEKLSSERIGLRSRFSEIQKKVSELKEKTVSFGRAEKENTSGMEKISSLEREIGRYEVMLSQAKARMKDAEKKDEPFSLNLREAEIFLTKFKKGVEEALGEKSVEKIKEILTSIKKELDAFYGSNVSDTQVHLGAGHPSSVSGKEKEREALRALEKKYKELAEALKDAKEKENVRTREKEKSIDFERELYRAEMELKESGNALDSVELKESQVLFRRGEMKKDIEEAENILGKNIVFREVKNLSEGEVEKDWRAIERMKIRLEESGNIGGDVLKEYDEVIKRDEFLETELKDLERSAESLKELILKMEEKIGTDFKSGIEKINEEFGRFFGLMFNGGKAELRIKNYESRIKNEDELSEAGLPEETSAEVETIKEEGIEILVSLPRKKISSLDVLSGGERALASIALLFAMSRVNPPPFLILDETDAALDESNSRKYAAMLKDLSKNTQLILVTHNRETMEAAKVLYGVTMDGSGISRLLSIKFEEAEQLTG